MSGCSGDYLTDEANSLVKVAIGLPNASYWNRRHMQKRIMEKKRNRHGHGHGQGFVTQKSEPAWWQTMLKKAAMALVVASGLTLLAMYKEAFNSFIRPTLTSGWARVQDHLFPMPDDKIIAVALTFDIPTSVNTKISSEGMSATFWPTQCKRPGGASIVRSFDSGERNSYTNAIVSISCSASGRTLVTLTPQSGAAMTIYEGIFKDGEKIAFPGAPGSYYAGLLTLYLLDTKEPAGPRVPVNECQKSNTCAKEFGKTF